MIKNILGEEVNIENCLGCEIVSGDIKPVGGILYKDDYFVVCQDFELPINGFIIISTVKHCERFCELTDDERIKMINLVNKIIKLLRSYDVCEEFNMIFEEKENIHFHVWIMPRHKWMKEKFGKIIKNIKEIQDYALENMRDEDNVECIIDTCNKLRKDLNNKYFMKN